jgi:hypothetical protein
MSRAVQPETEAVNADSFLDIVASIVSIMIIMILMIGLKIKRSPVTVAAPPEVKQIRAELVSDLATEQSLRREVLTMAAEIQDLQQQTAAKKQERDFLAFAVTSLEEKTSESGKKLAEQSQEDAALGRTLSLARSQLEEIERQRIAVETAPAPPVQIESYPTPLSRPVAGRELHFQLRAGRLTFIPLESLIEQFKSQAERNVGRLRDLREVTETVGPEGGFRLRYTLERVDVTPDKPGAHGGAYVRLKRWTLIPVADDLGETLDETLKPGSQFRQVTADRRFRGATVTLWTYPDSFDAFRAIKKELYQSGFPVAGRPLPEGILISGSPEGTRSAAQ